MPTFGSLFAGIGGIDWGLERTGWVCKWQVEIDPYCLKVLEKHWPHVPKYGDIRQLTGDELEGVELIAGGDPCQCRSRARSIWGSKVPDLWPEFRRIVHALRPAWVLRENVVSVDVDAVCEDLRRLGYRPVVLKVDSAEVTGQSRPRQYIVAVLTETGMCPGQIFPEPESVSRDIATGKKEEPVAACLTCHPYRMDSRDNYVFEPGRGVRILVPEERERLQGFPAGWTAGLSDRQRARVIGQAVTVPVVGFIGRAILNAYGHRKDERKC